MIEVRQSSLAISAFLVKLASSDEEVCILRADLNRLLVILQRAVEYLPDLIELCTHGERADVVTIEGNGLVVIIHRVLSVALLRVNKPAVRISGAPNAR